MNIDTHWHYIETGFYVVGNYFTKHPLEERSYFYIVKKQNSLFSDTRLIYTYINTCRIAIRMIPDCLLENECEEKIERLIKSINVIPSSSTKCSLLSEMAITGIKLGT